MRDFTKIRAWQLADDFAVQVYQLTRSFPREELYGLTNQLRRASYSIAANIVEGASRNSQKDYLHFLYIGRGSLAESQYFLHLAGRLKFADAASLADVTDQGRKTYACLHGLITAMETELAQKTQRQAKQCVP